MSEEWITTKNAAEISSYHPEYLRELVRTGRINGRKFGTVWQVDKQSLINYLQANLESEDQRKGPK